MDQIAVISDIHANPFALRQVLDDIRRQDIRQVFCLGDIVGYNMLPGETIRLLREAAIPAVKGNHDMMATGELPINGGPRAQRGIHLTQAILAAEERHFLLDLPNYLHPDPAILMLHSRWDDPVRYLREADDYREQYHLIRSKFSQVRFCFTGHTHGATVMEIGADGVAYERSSARVLLWPDKFYFINPGSVGYPRRSDYRASYAIFDLNEGVLRFVRVSYPKRRMILANARHRINLDLGQSPIHYAVVAFMRRVKAVVRSSYEPKRVGYRSRSASRPGGYPRTRS